MAFEVENLETSQVDLRARGVTFERFEMSGFDVRDDTIAAPDNYPSKGTGELGASPGRPCSCAVTSRGAGPCYAGTGSTRWLGRSGE
jgi:hypothetical protein